MQNHCEGISRVEAGFQNNPMGCGFGLSLVALYLLKWSRGATNSFVYCLRFPTEKKTESIAIKPILKIVTALINPTGLFIHVSENWAEIASFYRKYYIFSMCLWGKKCSIDSILYFFMHVIENAFLLASSPTWSPHSESFPFLHFSSAARLVGSICVTSPSSSDAKHNVRIHRALCSKQAAEQSSRAGPALDELSFRAVKNVISSSTILSNHNGPLNFYRLIKQREVG